MPSALLLCSTVVFILAGKARGYALPPTTAREQHSRQSLHLLLPAEGQGHRRLRPATFLYDFRRSQGIKQGIREPLASEQAGVELETGGQMGNLSTAEHEAPRPVRGSQPPGEFQVLDAKEDKPLDGPTSLDRAVESVATRAAKSAPIPGKLPGKMAMPRGGESREDINRNMRTALFAISMAWLVGYLIDTYILRRKGSEGRPGATMVSVLAASYGLLVPAFFATLFSFSLVVGVLGVRISVSTDEKGQAAAIAPSMLSLVQTLWKTGSWPGAVLILWYAVVLPIAKLLLLLSGEMLRLSQRPARVLFARRCVRLVQVISKWAAPDLFAYIVLLYIFRSLEDPELPTIETSGHLDVGFVCFGLFCLVSTLSSLFIHPVMEIKKETGNGTLAEKETEKVDDTETAAEQAVEGHEKQLEYAGDWRVVAVAAVLILGFGMLLAYGVSAPCLSLSLSVDGLKRQLNSSIPQRMESLRPLFKGFLDKLVRSLTAKVQSDVSLWSCMAALWSWAREGQEASCFLAWGMLAIFAIALSVADMLLLFVAALQLSLHEKPSGVPSSPNEGRSKPSSSPERAMKLVRILKHLTMLDVCITGIFVVCWAGSIYEEQGVLLRLHGGFFALLGAELLHYTMYFLVLLVYRAL
mmetsp:Transcript_10489/g.23587  ORF Transcript_10489/g.23587 Transcript_10489/m.23587 type:complete len:639 (+) Transcript_10489:164-2080(+)|eukprot:CAMPEP_0170617798 /NCGR_PEP_ID=MMETSP0224-20130122/26615_1 /TAXON_ID=285029 /ORGANISM="Togula jolla, Strain CCCM 725" /LENGTH=638 /DNA_ID=CAMNT_0010943725 /DNA_START=83 /DNA_END=1999 /DNA_ORIENTATION=-